MARKKACTVSRRFALLEALAVAAFSACGPIQSGSLIVDAQAELAAAQTAQAERQAPYEYVAAEEYLHKAREKQSYSDFEVSVVYAKKARDCARAARAIAEARSRATLGDAEPAPSTSAQCRPGPERAHEAPPPDEEPAVHEPEDPKPVTHVAPPAKPVAPPTPKAAPPQEREPQDPLPDGDTPPSGAPSKAKEPPKTQPGETPPIRSKRERKARPRPAEDSMPEGDDEGSRRPR